MPKLLLEAPPSSLPMSTTSTKKRGKKKIKIEEKKVFLSFIRPIFLPAVYYHVQNKTSYKPGKDLRAFLP